MIDITEEEQNKLAQIGQQLKTAREQKNLSLNQVAEVRQLWSADQLFSQPEPGYKCSRDD